MDSTVKSIIDAHRNAYNEELKKQANSLKQKNKIIMFSLIFCCLCVGLLFVILPLKQTQPVLAIVDANNGIVKAVEYEKAGSKVTNNQALIQSYAWDYVVSRYGYDYTNSTNLEEQYQRVYAFTAENIREDFKKEISNENPNSPFNLYGDTGKIKIENINAVPLSGDRVQVNFTSKVFTNINSYKIYSYTAIGHYQWDKYDGLNIDDRRLNPFGFQFDEWVLTQNSSADANQETQRNKIQQNVNTTNNTANGGSNESIK